MPRKSKGLILPVVLGILGVFLLVYAYMVEETRSAALMAAHTKDYQQAKQAQSDCDTHVKTLYHDEQHHFQQVDMVCQVHRTRVHLRKVMDVTHQRLVSWVEFHDLAT